MPTNQSLDPAHEEGAVRRRAADAAGGAAERTPVHPLLTLQRQVGNAAIARMLAQREGEENLDKEDPAEGVAQAKHDPAIAQRDDDEPTDGVAQAKPEVGLEGGPVSDGVAGRIQSARGG